MRFFWAVMAAVAACPAIAEVALTPGVPVRSIDIADTDFSDLAPVGKDVGDARIVMLGEQTHGDGASFAAKARLVRYLHERLGFDLLVFESGFTNLDLAQEAIVGGEAPSAALKDAVFPVWSHSDQFQPLLGWLDSNWKSSRPLTFAGMDMQFTGSRSVELPDRLESYARAHKLGSAELERTVATLRAFFADKRATVAALDPAAFRADSAVVRAQLERVHDARGDTLARSLDNAAEFLAFMKGMVAPSPAVFNRRDAMMADNIEWLAKRYPDKKMIVWAATSHALRSRPALRDAPTPEMISAGQVLAPRWKRGLYVLAVTSGGGKVGSYATRKISDTGEPATGSIEAGLKASGARFAFVPRAALAGERTSWALGYVPATGRWDEAVDGLLFVREQTPTSYPPSVEK